MTIEHLKAVKAEIEKQLMLALKNVDRLEGGYAVIQGLIKEEEGDDYTKEVAATDI